MNTRYYKIIDKHRSGFFKRNPGYLCVLVDNDFLGIDCSKIMLPRLADYNFRIWRNNPSVRSRVIRIIFNPKTQKGLVCLIKLFIQRINGNSKRQIRQDKKHQKERKFKFHLTKVIHFIGKSGLTKIFTTKTTIIRKPSEICQKTAP